MICECARTMYRNNFDGTVDRKLQGSLRCRKCRGHGRCVKCPDCTGAGINAEKKFCKRCFGSGFVPGKRPPMTHPNFVISTEVERPASPSAEGATTYQPRAQP